MSNGNHRIIALAVWGELISPVFDSAKMVVIADIEDGKIVSTRTESLGPELPYSRASRLSGWGAQVLICGAISSEFARMLEVSDILVVGFVSGNARHVLDAYLKGTLIRSVYAMPGCGRGPGPRRRRFRGGRG
jgi:predicted Fe-Mo cluster-binding NifX family protein